MAMCGGLAAARNADADVQRVCDQVRSDVETKANGGVAYELFEAVSVKTQVVAGINYFVKVKVSTEVYIHIRVYQDLEQKLTLHGYEVGKTADDEVVYL